MQNLKLLDELLIGRVEPVIYAFSTNTIPNCLKVGDTCRPLSQRLQEWRRYFPDLKEEFQDKAVLGREVFFRDYSVHRYLESELLKERLREEELPAGLYYSREFFKDTSAEDLRRSIRDIRKSWKEKTGKYRFYRASDHLPQTYAYASTGKWEPRPNQAETVEAFQKAVKAGRTNLLMYAVMRFGKSFTSMLCAQSIRAELVLIVSGKADVKEEWKKTIESAGNFNGEYVFLGSEKLMRDRNALENVFREGKKAAVFLTLQDLQGEKIKEKHRELFDRTADLLIVDETHFGARAEKYGQVLREREADDDSVSFAEAEEQMKILRARIRLHLSGTPYRILMGSEFSREDLVCFCQFSDIVKAQEAWDREHLLSGEEEWENPYFGFPQMIRFAFHPGQASVKRLRELRSSGYTYAFSALFQPVSVKKDVKGGGHRRFVYEEEILELLEAIDGSREEEGLLGFLDYPKIKEGSMCRHMVCVLPYCASCDALEVLIERERGRFKNLGDYKLVNISGVDRPGRYKSSRDVKERIRECEAQGEKTLTLTVNRMLTGSTVEQWDTMIYFKDTASPQEYDQAVFRLQNQYVQTLTDPEGKTIRYNRKPQTLLVDFDPHRMFRMQEQKSLIYNANTEKNGNLRLRERMEEELRISPIVTINRDRMERVEPADILSAVSAYSNSRGVMDEAREIPVDLSLLNHEEIRRLIERQAALGSNQGFETGAVEGEETELEIPDIDGEPDTEQTPKEEVREKENPDEWDWKKLEDKFRTYYSRLLFYAFLTKDEVYSLEEILDTLNQGENPRIARNLQISRGVLQLFAVHMNAFVLSRLDYKIQNISRLAKDSSLPPMERALTAIRKFERLSSSEVATPEQVTEKMTDLLPDACFRKLAGKNHVILDLAGKAGEFAIAVSRRCEKLGLDREDIKDAVWTIPTSSVAYEFTRKIYEVLGLNTACIAESFYSYDLLKITKTCQGETQVDYEKITRILSQGKPLKEISLEHPPVGGNIMKFEAVVGNPPYQEIIHSDTDNSSLSRQLFPYYMIGAMELGAEYVCLITPARWFAGDAQDKSFIKLRKYIREHNHIQKMYYVQDARELFPNVEIKGGIQYFLACRGYEGELDFYRDQREPVRRSLFAEGLDIVISDMDTLPILEKVRGKDFKPLTEITTGRNAFGIIGKPSVVNAVSRPEPFEGSVPLRCKANAVRYMKPEAVKKNTEIFRKYKVFVSKSAGNPNSDQKVIGYPYVGEPFSACTDSLIPIGKFDTLFEAENLAKYMKTRFLRFLVQTVKSSQNVTQIVYRFVPMQDFTEKSDIDWSGTVAGIERQLYEKYGLTDQEIACIEETIRVME